MHTALAPSSLLILLVVLACHAGDTALCRFPVAAQFTEDMITLSWGNVAGAAAYNVYADYGTGFSKANFAPIASRNRFSLLWMGSQGARARVVKGNRVVCRVVPLFAKTSPKDTAFVEGEASCSVRNDYFRGFAGVLCDTACAKVLETRQRVKKIYPAAVSVERATFCSRYARLARDIYTIYKSKVDPKDEGACVPFSTLVAKYFTKRGIACYRVQGLFIGAFHSFDVVVVDSVEYVLDFTADQYVPNSSPVFMPRDYCFADSCGEPTARPGGISTAFYRAERIFTPDQVTFTETPKARAYQQLLDSLEKE